MVLLELFGYEVCGGKCFLLVWCGWYVDEIVVVDYVVYWFEIEVILRDCSNDNLCVVMIWGLVDVIWCVCWEVDSD